MLIVATIYRDNGITTLVLPDGDNRINKVVPDYLLTKANTYVTAADGKYKALGVLIDGSPEPMLSVFLVSDNSVVKGEHYFGRHITSAATIEHRGLRKFLGTRNLNAETIEKVIDKF